MFECLRSAFKMVLEFPFTTDTLIPRTATTIVLQQNMLRGVDAVYAKTLAE